MITVTIDTNLINTRQSIEGMNIIERLNSEGTIKIYKTDAMDTEMADSREPFAQGLKKSQRYSEDMGVAVYGHTRYGHGVYGGDENGDVNQALIMILFPGKSASKLKDNEIKDVMHLATHLMHKRDFFLTKDYKHILTKKSELEVKLGIKVRSPEEFLIEISK